MNLPTTFVRISLAAVLAVAAVGCRKGDKNLTPIPDGSSSYTDGGYNSGPSGDMMLGDRNNGARNGLGDGSQFDNNNFQPGNDIQGGGNDLSGSGLPDDPDKFAGKNEDRLDSSLVYFDFDSYSVSPSELPKIVTVAMMMKEKQSSLVRIEGHCDERGTEEYNRALGERRALSVRDVLIKEGVSPSRINTESWGEDRPAMEGNTEAAYSKNRRGEFVLLTQ
jgi:peptidoglycan-associated lipoprotein